MPPLFDEKGKLIRDRYLVTINLPEHDGMEHACASEWGMVGDITEAARLVGEDGRRQVKITVTVEPGEKTGTLGSKPSAPVQQGPLTEDRNLGPEGNPHAETP